MEDITLKQQVAILKLNCFERISNLVRLYGLDEGMSMYLNLRKTED